MAQKPKFPRTMHIKLQPGIREALERAAAKDQRTLSAMARMIIIEWLQEQKLLRREL